jgi:hypothetical protein
MKKDGGMKGPICRAYRAMVAFEEKIGNMTTFSSTYNAFGGSRDKFEGVIE